MPGRSLTILDGVGRTASNLTMTCPTSFQPIVLLALISHLGKLEFSATFKE